jgi:iron complex transport system substrate-binding protein
MSGGKRFCTVFALFLAGVGVSLALERLSGPRAAPSVEPQPGAAAPQRIIALAPSIVESLYALGAGERVVAVGDFCRFPLQASEKPRVGGEFNPSLEQLLALKPDLLIVQGKAERLHAFCRRHRIPILHVNTDTLATLRSGLRRIGRAIGREPQADALVAEIDLALARLESRLVGRPRPKAFLCMGHQPGSLRGLSTAHGKSFLSEILDVAGGQNVLADLQTPYPAVSKEALLTRAPDVILDLHPGENLSDEARRQLLDDWRAMASLPAVRNGRTYVLTEDYLMIPGPRVVHLARRLTEVLHPDVKVSDE